MAQTARPESEKKEHFDSPEVLEGKVKQLAQWIRESDHFIAFTGAGVSTSAGIPDFRSGMNTSLNTGPGVWELQAHGSHRDKKYTVTSTLKALPTPTHMTLVKLQQEGLLRCVISQNTDGLHRRSGLPRNSLYELHGNGNLEVCVKCGRDYLRDYNTRSAMGVRQHFTGRNCDDPDCKGRLKDTIINFGENLPDRELTESFEHADKADLCLAMGSSLTVTPAANIPEQVALRRKRLIIVNLQSTPLDDVATMRINAKCDDVTKVLMKELQLEIPEFRLNRQVELRCSAAHNGRSQVTVQGRDSEGHPFSFIKGLEVGLVGQKEGKAAGLVSGEGLSFSFPWEEQDKMVVTLKVFSRGHYGEPALPCEFTAVKGKDVAELLVVQYNPFTRQWKMKQEDIAADTHQ